MDSQAHDRRRLGRPTRLAIALGLIWGHLSLVSAGVFEMPSSSLRGGGLWPLMLGRWTFGLPVTLADMLSSFIQRGHVVSEAAGSAAWALPLPALIGCALAWGVVRFCGLTRLRSVTHGMAVALCLGALLSGIGVAQAHDQERAAEELFLDAMATDDQPWLVPASRAAARTLIRRYPHTRWASEAWRIAAFDAETCGDLTFARMAWREFRDCFSDDAPGYAFGSLRLAQLAEEGSTPQVAYEHYLEARRCIARAGPEFQRWVFADATTALARIAWSQGLYATAAYWKTASVHLSHTENESSEG